MVIDWATVGQLLNPLAILLVIGLGVIIGVIVITTGRRLDLIHAYWQVAGGTLFFIPLAVFAVFRRTEGLYIWERNVSLWFLWLVYIASMLATGVIYRRWHRRKINRRERGRQ
jgi:hypothetical protein